jgi:hypothetical protein
MTVAIPSKPGSIRLAIGSCQRDVLGLILEPQWLTRRVGSGFGWRAFACSSSSRPRDASVAKGVTRSRLPSATNGATLHSSSFAGATIRRAACSLAANGVETPRNADRSSKPCLLVCAASLRTSSNVRRGCSNTRPARRVWRRSRATSSVLRLTRKAGTLLSAGADATQNAPSAPMLGMVTGPIALYLQP